MHGDGVDGAVQAGDAKADETNKPLWQSKCGSCHDLRSPSNRSLSPAQWAATVERMVKVRQAPISPEEQTKITQFLVGAARAGKLTAQLKIAGNAPPQVCEVRVVTSRGVSSAAYFEVGRLPEIMAANGKREQAQPVTLPCAVNGSLQNNAERHWLKFTAKQGQRLVFNLKAFRCNDTVQLFFNPQLRLYDAAGHELAENHGYYDLDPLLDWQCPADGDYALLVQDMLGRGNPGSVYRLTMGAIPYDTYLFPPGGQVGTQIKALVVGKNMEPNAALTFNAPARIGLNTLGTNYGMQQFIVSPYPTARDDANGAAVMLPASFAGRVDTPGQPKKFTIHGTGEFEFNVFNGRMDSPLAPRIKILKPDGGTMQEWEEGRRKVKLDPKLTYTLQIEDREKHGGPDYVYFIEARPLKPALECSIRNDTISLRPGTSAAVEVLITRSEELDGEMTVSAPTLPPGISAAPITIPADRRTGWLIFHADANAAPAEQPIGILVTGHGSKGDVTTVAIPQAHYKIANDDHYADRAEEVIAVCGQADFGALLASDSTIRIHPRKAVEVKVKIKRRDGWHNNVTARVVGLPQGWTTNEETIGGDRDEMVLHVRPDGGNTSDFLKRDAKFAPIVAVIEVWSDEFHFVAGTLTVLKADNIQDKD